MPSEHGVRGDIRQFLITRRARLTPEQAGLPDYGGRRRVSGLRREEVALLAGISIEYYTRLERGNARGVSDEVIERLARALHLDEVERSHLIDLVRAAGPSSVRWRPTSAPTGVRRSVQQILDSMTSAAAFVRNARLDVLAANQLGSALYCQLFDDPGWSANLARFVFLDPRATQFYRDWTGIAHDAVGSLRSEAGRNPHDQILADLIGELSDRSEQFRTRWAAHNVTYYRTGTQPFHHPVAGDLDLDFDALEIAADPGLTIVAYTAPPGSAARQAFARLSRAEGTGRKSF
jgi:transcriptional regulator with XRE-family HTH domain